MLVLKSGIYIYQKGRPMYRALCKNSNGSTILTAVTHDLLHMLNHNLINYDSTYALVQEDYIDMNDIFRYVTKFISLHLL